MAFGRLSSSFPHAHFSLAMDLFTYTPCSSFRATLAGIHFSLLTLIEGGGAFRGLKYTWLEKLSPVVINSENKQRRQKNVNIRAKEAQRRGRK